MPKAKQAVTEEGAVVAKTVEPVRDNTAGMDLEECIQSLQEKHPELRFAWPSKESVRFHVNGWQPIRITEGGTTFRKVPVDNLDDADQTTGTVLCMRPVEVDIRARAKDEARRKMFNEQVRQNSTSTGNSALGEAFSMMGGGGLKAKQLPDDD